MSSRFSESNPNPIANPNRKVKEDGQVEKAAVQGRVTSFDQWKAARKEEIKMDKARGEG
jgi:hypothetical protein